MVDAQPRRGGGDGGRARSAGLELARRARRERGELDDYQLLHSARAGLLRRLGRDDEAAAAYARALELATNPVERRFLERRLAPDAHAAPDRR